MPGQHMALAERVRDYLAINPQDPGASGTTNGESLDTQLFEGYEAVLALGNTDRVVDFKLQDSADNSTFADITGAAITQLAATDDNKIAVISVWRPRRYVRPVTITGAGGLVTLLAVVGRGFNPTGQTPVAAHADRAQLVKKAVN